MGVQRRTSPPSASEQVHMGATNVLFLVFVVVATCGGGHAIGISRGIGKTNANALVWQPPLDSFIAKNGETGEYEDMTTQTVLVLYEVLQNQTFYNLTDLSNVMAYIAGVPEFGVGFQRALIDVGLPPIADTLVRVWKTDLLSDMFKEIQQQMNATLVADFRGLFAELEDQDLTKEERQGKTIDLVVNLAIALLRDPDSILWADLTAILGDPLGPALIPTLKSGIIENTLSDPEGIRDRAMEKQDELIKNLKSLAGKIVLFNPYFPEPCLRNTTECPDLGSSKEATELQELFVRAADGDESVGDAFGDLQSEFLKIFLEAFGLKDLVELLGQALNSPSTDEVLSTLSEDGELSNKEVWFLNNLSSTEGVAISNEAAGVPLEPLACLANISALMFEPPETKAGWAQGLGLQIVGETETSGFLSSMVGVFLDVESDAIVVAYEGIPYLAYSAARGLFGWLQSLLSAEEVPFEYPCDASDDKDLCNGLAEAFPDARVYKGFLPHQTKSGDQGFSKVQKIIDQALEEWKAQAGPESPSKPSIYFTGHSLGGPAAKNSFVQFLLRGQRDKFSKAAGYFFALPVTGNAEYINMTTQLLDSTESDVFMFINQYDFVPYLPPMGGENATHGEHTLFFDHDTLELKKIDTADYPVEIVPRNVFMPPLGHHSIKAQYLPLSRAAAGGSNTNATCEYFCDVGQCGYWKCPDTCSGLL